MVHKDGGKRRMRKSAFKKWKDTELEKGAQSSRRVARLWDLRLLLQGWAHSGTRLQSIK